MEEKVALLTAEVAELKIFNEEAITSNKLLTESVLRAVSLLDTKCEKWFSSNNAAIAKESIIDFTHVGSQVSKTWSYEPPKTKDELSVLNEKAKDPAFVQETLSHFARVCAKDVYAKLDGKHSSGYRLIDHLVHRELLLLCTWYGSKDKFEFKVFESAINLIFEVIRYADSGWTIFDNQNFLISCMHNSKARVNATGLRTSSSRPNRGPRRAKGLEIQNSSQPLVVTALPDQCTGIEIAVPSGTDMNNQDTLQEILSGNGLQQGAYIINNLGEDRYFVSQLPDNK